jgi:hypothetical protein
VRTRSRNSISASPTTRKASARPLAVMPSSRNQSCNDIGPAGPNMPTGGCGVPGPPWGSDGGESTGGAGGSARGGGQGGIFRSRGSSSGPRSILFSMISMIRAAVRSIVSWAILAATAPPSSSAASAATPDVSMVTSAVRVEMATSASSTANRAVSISCECWTMSRRNTLSSSRFSSSGCSDCRSRKMRTCSSRPRHSRETWSLPTWCRPICSANRSTLRVETLLT